MDTIPRLRRAMRLRCLPDRVEAEVEDDFHHFGVALQHDGVTVTGVVAWARRYPWTTCAGATHALEAIRGAELNIHPSYLFAFAAAVSHCTHMFELSAFAIAHAAARAGDRLYEAEVSDELAGKRRARIIRDGALMLDCELEGDVVSAPSPYAGLNVFSIRSRDLKGIGPEAAELLLILRRIVAVSRGRLSDLDAIPDIASLGRPLNCYSGGPKKVGEARRVIGSTRDWSAGPGPAANSGPPSVGPNR